MDAIKELKNNNKLYYLIAFCVAIVVGYLLIFVFDFSLILGKLALQYWWGVLIGLVVILLLKRIGRKRKKEK